MQRPRTPYKRWMCVTSGSAHESSQASVIVKFLKVQSKKRGRMLQDVVVCKQNPPVCNACLILWMLVHARVRDVGVAGGSVGKSPPFPPTTLQQHQHCSMYNTHTAPKPTRPTPECFSRSPPASKSQQPRHCRRDHSRI